MHVYIYPHKLFVSKSQTHFFLKGKMATFNDLICLSVFLLNLEGGVSHSTGVPMALGGTENKGRKGEEPFSMLVSQCRLAACTKVTAGKNVQPCSGKLRSRYHNFSDTAHVLAQTLGCSQEGSRNAVSNWSSPCSTTREYVAEHCKGV